MRTLRQSFRRLQIETLETRQVLATFVVTNLDDSGVGSLRQAIMDANTMSGADTVQFADGVSGTIALSSGELEITDELSLRGPGASQITIDANGRSRVINISTNLPVAIRNLTITDGGVGGSGAGIFSLSEDLLVTDSIITGNRSMSGRGAGLFSGFFLGGNNRIINTEISNNHTYSDYGHGAGFYSYYSYNVLFNVTIRNNRAFGESAKGGGLFTRNDTTIINSDVSGNQTLGDGGEGGGVYVSDGRYVLPSLIIRDSEIKENATFGRNAPGGAIFMVRYTGLEIARSKFDANRTLGDASPGGAIYKEVGRPLVATDSTFVDNRTLGESSPGGAIATDVTRDSDLLAFDAVTMKDNRTRGRLSPGGALATSGRGMVTLSDSRLTDNYTSVSESPGGAMSTGRAMLADSIVTGNHTAGNSSPGGALHSDKEVALLRTVVSNNETQRALSDGGGLDIKRADIRHSKISNNRTLGSNSHGGGISFDAGEIFKSSVVFNRAARSGSDGGGIHAATTESKQVTSSTISHNLARDAGGGIMATNARVDIRYSTITKNDALPGRGSGLGYSGAGTRLDLQSNIIAGNHRSDINGIDTAASDRVDSLGFNLIGTGDALSEFIASDQTGITNPKLGPLRNNGGFGPTHVPFANSPAIDQGKPNPRLNYDQRGFGFDRQAGPRSDSGAVERQPNDLEVADSALLFAASVDEAFSDTKQEPWRPGKLAISIFVDELDVGP